MTNEPEPAASSPEDPDREESRHEETPAAAKPAGGDKPTFAKQVLDGLWRANTPTVTILAIVLAIVIGGILMIVSDAAVRSTFTYFFAQPSGALNASWALVSDAYANLFKGALFDPSAVGDLISGNTTDWRSVLYPISETLTYATPLIFTGLGVALAFRGGLFNIGGQGQAIMGVILAGVVGFALHLPVGVHLILAIIAGFVGGALWGFIPGILKARTGAHEVITTIMLNYIAQIFLNWLIIQKGIKGPKEQAISKELDPSSKFPAPLGGNLRLDFSILLALLAAASVAWLLNRSTLGFELRAVGANPHAARTAGMSVTRTTVLVMVIAGGLAGLGGSIEVLGTQANALTGSVTGTVGFDGILVALLGRVKPWGVVLAAILFGGLQAGGQRMQSYSGVSLELSFVLEALIVLFVAAPAVVKAIFRLRAARGGQVETTLAKGW